jgi:predicted acetyltransferase
MSGRTLAYRAVPDDDEHRPVYRRLLQYAFAPERGPDWDDDPHEQPAEFEPRGLYEPSSGVGDTAETDTETETPTASARPREATDVAPGGLVVASALVDFRMRIRGAFRPVGGVTAVASPPEHRRRGHVGTLLDHLHEELRERDVGVAALWPFSHAFYRRFDYGRTNDYVQFEFPPDALDSPAATPDEDGSFRRLAADDPAAVEALAALHERSAPEPLALDRSPDWWRHRVFRTWTGERFVYGWGDTDDQELRAYLVYGFEEDDPGRTLAVTYWGAADDEAYRQLLTFLRNHDSQVSQVRLFAGDTSLLDRLSDPADDVTTTVKPGPMVRVVDVEAALSRLATPATDERVVLSVRDPRYDWNDDRFELSVDDGLTTCRRVGADGNVDVDIDIDIDIDISALSRVLVGARSAAVLARLGHVAGDADAVTQLDSLLPVESPAPYLREWF